MVRLSQKNGCGVIFGAAASLFLGGTNMEKTIKRILCALLLVTILAGMLSLSGCRQEPLVIKDSDTCIVLKVTEEALGGKTDMVLIDYMRTLTDKGEMVCTIENGMVTSINGIENPTDYSSCWMLYTSDEELSNSGWGVVEYEGKQYGSAISGAETLPIKADRLYIWVYKSFS